jgi:hypothetical protein
MAPWLGVDGGSVSVPRVPRGGRNNKKQEGRGWEDREGKGGEGRSAGVGLLAKRGEAGSRGCPAPSTAYHPRPMVGGATTTHRTWGQYTSVAPQVAWVGDVEPSTQMKPCGHSPSHDALTVPGVLPNRPAEQGRDTPSWQYLPRTGGWDAE